MSERDYPRLVDADTLAHVLGVSVAAVVKMSRTGELVVVRSGKGARFDLDATLARLSLEPHLPRVPSS